MLRVALPKGRLLNNVKDVLGCAGLSFTSTSDRDYAPVACWNKVVTHPHSFVPPEITAKVIKVRAIPQLVGLGNFQVGFCGLDLLRESTVEGEAIRVLNLGLNPVKLVVAVAQGQEDIITNPPQRPLVIATEYERIAQEWAMGRQLAHIVVQTFGSTEGYAPQDADIVFDCVESGKTMKANNLTVIDHIMDSATWMIANVKAYAYGTSTRGEIDYLKQRVESALGNEGGLS